MVDYRFLIIFVLFFCRVNYSNVKGMEFYWEVKCLKLEDGIMEVLNYKNVFFYIVK